MHCCYCLQLLVIAGCTKKISNFLKAHGALVESNCMEFPNLNFALDWAETRLLNSAYTPHPSSATERDDIGAEELDNRDKSFTKLTKGRKSIRKMQEVTLSLIIRTMLGLDAESTEYLDGIDEYYSHLVLEDGDFLFTPGETADEFFVLLEGELAFSMGKGHAKKSSQGLIVNKGDDNNT
jgi:hypothetical protein